MEVGVVILEALHADRIHEKTWALSPLQGSRVTAKCSVLEAAIGEESILNFAASPMDPSRCSG